MKSYKVVMAMLISAFAIHAMEQDVKSLVKKYPHPINWPAFEKEDLRQYTKDEIEPFLHPSIIGRQEQAYNKILDEGVSTQVCDEQGNTPLVTALLHGNKKAVLTLLNKKARVDYNKHVHRIMKRMDDDDEQKKQTVPFTTWDAALLCGDVDLINLIFERIPDKDTYKVKELLFEKPLITGDPPIVHALRTGNEKLFNFLMACNRHILSTVFYSDDLYANNMRLIVRFPSLAPLKLLFTPDYEHSANVRLTELLNCSVQDGNLPAVQFLLNQKRSRPTVRMVADAAIKERKDIAQEILKYKPQPDDHETALHYCVQTAHSVEPVKMLIDLGQDVNATTKYGETPLMVACKDLSKVPMVECLLQHKARVKPSDSRKCTALHYACQAVNEHAVPLLLKAGADVRATDSSGVTPLHLAVRCSKKTLESLLQAGADPNAVTSHGSTPLMEATTVETVKTLMEAGADIHACKDKLLLKATRHPNAKLIKMMLGLQAHVDITDEQGNTPLINWVKNCMQYSTENTENELNRVTRLFLKHGSDPNAQEKTNGLSPLHYAVLKYDNLSLVKLLIDAGAKVNLQSKSGQTPLDKAIDSGYKENIPLLLENGANPQLPDAKGQTAITRVAHKIACINKRGSGDSYWQEILQMLLKAAREEKK